MADSYDDVGLSALAAKSWLKNKRGGRIYQRCKKYIPEENMEFSQE